MEFSLNYVVQNEKQNAAFNAEYTQKEQMIELLLKGLITSNRVEGWTGGSEELEGGHNEKGMSNTEGDLFRLSGTSTRQFGSYKLGKLRQARRKG